MTARHFLLATMAAALICGNSYAAMAATPSHNRDVAAARSYIKDLLEQNGVGFEWGTGAPTSGGGSAPLADIRITSATVTFVTDPSFEWEFPLKNLKFAVGDEDGQTVLRLSAEPSRVLPASIGKTRNYTITLPDGFSSKTLEKIAADFAILSREASRGR